MMLNNSVYVICLGFGVFKVFWCLLKLQFIFIIGYWIFYIKYITLIAFFLKDDVFDLALSSKLRLGCRSLC